MHRAIVKLELATESGGFGNELVQNVSPLVLHFLPNSSSQVRTAPSHPNSGLGWVGPPPQPHRERPLPLEPS